MCSSVHYKQGVDTIRLAAMTLGVGENTRGIECPFCPTRDKEAGSLSVTREADELLFHCYRAKCGAKGHIPTVPTQGDVTTIKKVKSKVNSFTQEVSKLTDNQYRQLILNYNLTVDEIDSNGIKWCPSLEKLAIPLFDKNYLQWGWELKTIKGLEPHWYKMYKGIKSRVFPSVEGVTRMHYPKVSAEYIRDRADSVDDTVVLVEDAISATRVMRYRDSIALLGCSLSFAEMLEILEGYKNVIVALDADATDKAIKMAKTYSGYFNNFEVKQLDKDPKNMSEDELEKMFLLV